MSDAAVIALAGIVTTIAGFLFQAWQAERNRKWQKEDAQRTATVLAETTAAVASDLKKETMANRDALTEHAQVIRTELAHNTLITGKAYDAANNFETKLERLAKVFDSVHTDKEVQKKLMDLTVDTNDTVHEKLQPDVEAIKETLLHRDESNA